MDMAKPKIRFKGYTDDWEQRKLGEIAFSFEYGLNAAAKEYDGENKYIRITDIDNNTHEFLTYNLTSPDIDLTDAENYKLAEGDILLARTGASVGKSYIYRDSDGLVYYAGFLIRARIREEYDAEFVFQSTLTDKYNKYIAVTSQRSGQPGMNAQEYSEFEILVPEKEEQTKIGTYFRILDHLITLHQRKNIYFYEKVTLVWEQRKLGEVLDDMYNGQTPSRKRDEYWNGNIRWLSSGELNRGIVYSSIETITEEGKKSANLRVVPKGTFVMAITGLEASGTRGNCALLGFDTTLNQSCMALFPKQDILISQFLFQWYRMVGEEYGINYTQGTKQQSYNAELIKILPILLPSIDEQKKIASYLNSIDHLITLHQCKCHLLHKLLHNDWEQRKLEDIMDTVTDYVAAGSFEDIRNNVTYLNEPGYAQLVRTVDLKKKFTNNDSIYVDESAFKYLWRVNLNEECIVLPNIGANIGEVYFVEPSGLPYDNNVLGPNAILLKANEDTYFAFTALNNLTFQKQLFENVGSSGQPKFNKTELKSIQLYMPQNEEQEKIGQYFRDLDHLITLHHRKYIYILKSP